MQNTDLYHNLKYQLEAEGMIVTNDTGQYFACHTPNNKRFIQFNANHDGIVYFGIREDGDTRCVFNGIVESIDDYLVLQRITK